MRLLIITQAVDERDPVLGFFTRWITEFAKHCERIEVICLRKGQYELPTNVRVHSLGKEHGVSRARYVLNFYTYLWRLRRDYDAVFVHMNQEYVLLAGWYWKLAGKPVYLWRNHYAGSWLTNLAAFFAKKVFCTSTHSYTAKYKKTVLMPVGVDTEQFSPGKEEPSPCSILFLARMAPSKRPLILLEALANLTHEGVTYTASFVGLPLPGDRAYYDDLRRRAEILKLPVIFAPGVPHQETVDWYRGHAFFVNASPSGMFDKTLFEAAASGCLPLAASADWSKEVGEDLFFTDARTLTERLRGWLTVPSETRRERQELLHAVVEKHSLEKLAEKLKSVIT